MTGTVAARFDAWAGQDPEAACLVDEDGRTWTRSAYHARLSGVARVLADRGHGPGTHVAVLDGTSRHHLDVEYAVLLAGAVRVPMDPQLTLAELAAQLRDGEVAAVALGGRCTGLAAPLRDLLPGVDVIDVTTRAWESAVTAATARPHLAGPPPGPATLASLNFSGGTTGSPKAVMLTQENLATVVGTIAGQTGAAAGPVFLNVRPLWPISAVIVLARLLGGARVVLGRFDTATFPDLVREHGVTATSLVPTQVVRLLDAGLTSAGLETLRVLDIGAAPLPGDARTALVAVLGGRIGVNYGLTEAPWSCYLPPGEHSTPGRVGPRAASVGRAFEGYRVRVVGHDGTECAEGEVGEVRISGPHVMSGYWRRPDLSADALEAGWFRTGDLGRLDDGCLSIVGRLKEVIRSGGKSVVPTEVEDVLRTHPGVADAAVVGEPDREWGEIVTAYVELRPDHRASVADLTDHVRHRIASYKKPRVVHIVPELPRSHYGKVQKSRLPQLLTPHLTDQETHP